ncbi:TPA: hypothetical protein ACU8BJ_001250 [Neisseria subflava]
MARYRRNFIAGGTFFFTVKLAAPKSRLIVEHIGFACGLYGCAKTISTPFGRYRPTMRIIPCAGG